MSWPNCGPIDGELRLTKVKKPFVFQPYIAKLKNDDKRACDSEEEPKGYWDDSESPSVFIPCTCLPTCEHACKGQCGCKACQTAYSDHGYDEY